jgi:hypothetical protein
MSRLLTPKEIAERLRLKTVDRVYALIHSGELKASNIASGIKPRWVVEESEVVDFLSRREKSPRKKALRMPVSFREVKQYV